MGAVAGAGCRWHVVSMRLQHSKRARWGPATVGQAGQWDNSGNFTTLLWAPELTSKDQCKKGGWQDFGFKNQGQCVSSIARQT